MVVFLFFFLAVVFSQPKWKCGDFGPIFCLQLIQTTEVKHRLLE